MREFFEVTIERPETEKGEKKKPIGVFLHQIVGYDYENNKVLLVGGEQLQTTAASWQRAKQAFGNMYGVIKEVKNG